MERRWVQIENIHIGSRHREPDMAKVREIAKSIADIGLMNPPAIVFRDGTVVGDPDEQNVPVLIYGRHRLLALQELGKSAVECIVHEVDDLHAELMEIDENLARSDLSPAQEAAHILRRQEIWEEMNSGRNSPENRQRGRPSEFASEVAAVVGNGRNPESVKRDVNLKIARAREIGPDIQKIAGTSLDKGVEMDALIKLPKPERAALIDRASKGEKVSARPASTPKPAPTPKADKALSVVEALETIATGIVGASDADHAPASLAEFKRLWARMERADQEDALVWARQNIKDDFDPAKLWLARA